MNSGKGIENIYCLLEKKNKLSKKEERKENSIHLKMRIKNQDLEKDGWHKTQYIWKTWCKKKKEKKKSWTKGGLSSVWMREYDDKYQGLYPLFFVLFCYNT